MRKSIFFFSLFLAGLSAFSQNILYDPISTKVFSSEKYSGINGTPFLFDKWTTGTATTPNGTYKNLELKLDAYNNTLLFRKGDEGYEFQDRIVRFTLMPNPKDSSTYLYFKNGISGGGIKPEQYLQVLAEGKVSLYRSDIKLMTEVNEINRGVIKTFTSSTRYFIMKDKQLQSIKMNKKDVFEILKDKEQELDTYANQKNLSTRKEADLAKIIQYYNSL